MMNGWPVDKWIGGWMNDHLVCSFTRVLLPGVVPRTAHYDYSRGGQRMAAEVTEDRKVSLSPLGVPQIASHYERLIGEVESSDGQLGAILRFVCGF